MQESASFPRWQWAFLLCRIYSPALGPHVMLATGPKVTKTRSPWRSWHPIGWHRAAEPWEREAGGRGAGQRGAVTAGSSGRAPRRRWEESPFAAPCPTLGSRLDAAHTEGLRCLIAGAYTAGQVQSGLGRPQPALRPPPVRFPHT